MRACLFLLALATTAAADPLKDHRALTKTLDREERKYWRDFPGRLSEALKILEAPFSGKGGVDPSATYDYSAARALFKECRDIAAAHAEADGKLGASGMADAYEVLWKELLSVCKDIEAGEKDLEKARPRDRYVYDQRPGVLLDGLHIRLSGLVRAVAGWESLSTEGWGRAEKLDGRKSVLRQVAVLDACALAKDSAGAKKLLAEQAGAKDKRIRIAVADSLLDRDSLVPLLSDESEIVRRALLQAIARKGHADARWIAPVLAAFKRAKGLEKAEALAVLAAMTGQKFGYDEKRWDEWLPIYRKEIDEGRFDRKNIEIEEVTPKPAEHLTPFYGIATTSLRPVLIVEATSLVFSPADWKDRVTRGTWDWRNTRKQWESSSRPSHAMVIDRQLSLFLEKFPAQGRYGLVALQGDQDTPSTKGLVDLSIRAEKAVRKLLEKMTGRGWCPPLLGFQAAWELADDIDTFYYVNSGELRGGTHLTPELVLAAFARWNRFKRVVVHAIRIDNGKEPGETLMKGLAAASGGTYVWFEKPVLGR